MTLKKVMPEDAPPPYTPSDPLTPASTDASISIEDGRSPQLDPEEIPSYEHSLQQTANFVSAALFFSERPPTKPHGQDDPVLAHTITIYTRSQAKDYSRFPRCWRSRSDEVSSQDWLTFLNYLLPAHLGPASVHPELSRKLRREIERDHKDRCQETDEQRQARLSAVVEEWNQCFFRPRAMDVILVFAPESGIMTISPLCPQCYPSTVRSMPMRHGPHQTISRSQTEPTTSQQFRIPRRPVGGDAANSTFADEETCQSIADTDKEVVDLNQPSTPPRAPSRAFQISSWASALQNWATNISEQAQRYGEQVERQAMAHGRRVENNAESFGRMMEARGRSWEKYFDEQEKKMDRAGEKFEAACDRRSPWLYPWNPSGPWGRHAGGMGSSWGNQCHNGRDQPTSSRRRSASISSLSSFSSSSSSSDSDSVSVCSSDSDDDGVATATGSTCEVNGLREYRIQARNLSTEYRAKAAGLRHELCALRAAHKELKRNSGCGPGRNTLSHAKAAEARAIKIEVLNLRREYKAMRREFHQERKQLRRALRESKKEQRKAKKAERKSQRKNKGKAPVSVQLGDSGIARAPIADALPRTSAERISAEPSYPPMSPPPAYYIPSFPGPLDYPVDPASNDRSPTVRTQTPPAPPPKLPETDNACPKSNKGKVKCSGQDSEPKGMGWGWTNGGTARSKSSGLWKKKQEAQVLPSMQWSGDGKQETGVLPVDQEEREEHELEGDEISPRPG